MKLIARLSGSRPRKVAVFRALQLGDLICALPGLRALRAALPEAEIVLIGLPWARTFAERFSEYLDGLLEFPGFPGLPERAPDLARLPAFLVEAQQRGFDLAIQLHGSGSLTNPLTVLLGARRTAGFYRPGEFCPDPDLFLPYPDAGSEVRRLLRLVAHLGVPLKGEALEFPVYQADRCALAALPDAQSLRPGAYACVHPGARADSRRWPAERFAAVADALSTRGLRVVLTGSADEYELVTTVSQMMKTTPTVLAGQTDLGALAALLADARLLVSNDTGVSHVAAALRTPSVVIFSASDPARWAPADAQRHRSLGDPVAPCLSARDGASGVSVADVLAQVDDILATQPMLALGGTAFEESMRLVRW